jgi:hypothetical protein
MNYLVCFKLVSGKSNGFLYSDAKVDVQEYAHNRLGSSGFCVLA